MAALDPITTSRWPHDRPSWRLRSEAGKVAAIATLLNADGVELGTIPVTVTIAIAASATTDGMDITITAKDVDGNTVAGYFTLTMWMSESAAGAGLTGDSYSGDLTAGTGKILGTLTSKKAWVIQTHSTGIFVATLVDSANPADQYVVVAEPLTGRPVVSEISDDNWEGA